MLEHEVECECLGDPPIAQDGRGANCRAAYTLGGQVLSVLQVQYRIRDIIGMVPTARRLDQASIVIQSTAGSLGLRRLR